MKTTLTEGWEERFVKALQKIFDRSFTITTENLPNGKFRIVVTEQDSGGPVMTVGDVACLLQVNRSVVRQMTKGRAQRGVHPIPFYKINGKALRFDRVKIMRWLETTPTRRRIPEKGKRITLHPRRTHESS